MPELQLVLEAGDELVDGRDGVAGELEGAHAVRRGDVDEVGAIANGAEDACAVLSTLADERPNDDALGVDVDDAETDRAHAEDELAVGDVAGGLGGGDARVEEVLFVLLDHLRRLAELYFRISTDVEGAGLVVDADVAPTTNDGRDALGVCTLHANDGATHTCVDEDGVVREFEAGDGRDGHSSREF